ncbi:MAG: VOC family protein [Deltaproteobacteria bacterium]|nr:VOC family protein [Deltaproteobacteria bacterium]
MKTRMIAAITIVVREYDEAIAWFTGALGFVVREDTDLGNGKRWVRVAPSSSCETSILLARADGEAQLERVGDQTGGRVALFLYTDDFARDHRRMVEQGVVFHASPRTEPYGTVVVFEDLYGNRWDLIEPRT